MPATWLSQDEMVIGNMAYFIALMNGLFCSGH